MLVVLTLAVIITHKFAMQYCEEVVALNDFINKRLHRLHRSRGPQTSVQVLCDQVGMECMNDEKQ